jgi:hypothetical protein
MNFDETTELLSGAGVSAFGLSTASFEHWVFRERKTAAFETTLQKNRRAVRALIEKPSKVRADFELIA